MQPNTDLLSPLTTLGYRPVARLRARHAREITGSPWGVGCETLDRDYVDFAHTGQHLGELGAKRVRLQAGWAKCERVPGQYDWAWLDVIVDSCIEQGVTPWLQISYGNPAWPGGGGIGLAQGIPTSPEALAAWDRWAHALVAHYRGRVTHYEIWNEPDLFGAVPPEAYTAFFIRTAEQVRAADEQAQIIGLALCHNEGYAGEFLACLARAGARDLLDEITWHMYPHIPEQEVDMGDKIARLCQRHGYGDLPIHQGETGAPSDTVQVGALSHILWNERKQAVWDLRRLLAHHASGRAMSLFTLGDIYYNQDSGALFAGRNPKGLLCLLPDLSVAYRKPSYFAAQHIFSIFDEAWPLRSLAEHPGRYPQPVKAHAWRRAADPAPSLLAWWQCDAPPECLAPPLTLIGLDALEVRDPVLVDFMSGIVFEKPAHFENAAAAWWASLPCSDSPLALAEREVLPLKPL